MNKLRVFQNVKKKRTVSGFSLGNLGTVLLMLLFLPYIITLFWGNLWQQEEGDTTLLIKEQLCSETYTVINKTALGEERIPLELYVADQLQRTMGDNYEKEALKAQAVLIRTNLLEGERAELLVEDEVYGKEKISDACFLATAETKGMCLVYDGKPVYGAYFKVSNGATRCAEEVLLSADYPYLQSVTCDRDFLSEEYTEIKTFSMMEFEKGWENLPKTNAPTDKALETAAFAEDLNIQILRDSAGYVKFIRYQEKWVAGENFRYAFELSSSDFRMQLQNNEVIITTKGSGHGMGLSQFGANEMAKEGKNYLEILAYFFQNTSMTKVE